MKWLQREAEHSPCRELYTSTPPYIFMAWCLTRYRQIPVSNCVVHCSDILPFYAYWKETRVIFSLNVQLKAAASSKWLPKWATVCNPESVAHSRLKPVAVWDFHVSEDLYLELVSYNIVCIARVEIIFFWGLFYSTVSYPDCLMVGWLVNDNLERVLKEAGRVPSWHLPGGTERECEMPPQSW
jgi:hypothetical protein